MVQRVLYVKQKKNIGKNNFLNNSKVIVAAELLKNADQLVKQKIHPTSVISGFKLACKLVISLPFSFQKKRFRL